MKTKLQFTPENRTRDWFLYRDYTIIRVYGFSEAPYILPTFLTPRIFSLEFIRQRLHSETKHFLNYKKSSNIKFPFNMGPFSLKVNQLCP
jgi:hypothetical protein